MGSSSSKNTVPSSPPEANERRRTEGHRKFHSRCFYHSADSTDKASNSSSHEGPCGGNMATASVNEVVGDNDPVTSLSGKIKCISKFSRNCVERNQNRLFHPVSDASSSSTQVYRAQALESSSNFSCRSSDRGEIVEQSVHNCSLNGSSCNKHNSNLRLRRARSLGSSEAYSFFARRLRRQSSSVERNRGFDNGHLRNRSDQQQVQGSRSHNFCESRPRHQSDHSMQARVVQCTDLPLNALEWENAFSEPSSEAHRDNRASQHDLTCNINQSAASDQNVSSVIDSYSTPVESRDARRIQRRGTPEHVEDNVSFRRTRSVGRLRDRVLRRTTSSEGSFGVLQGDSVARETRQHNGRRFWEALTRASSNRHAGTTPTLAQDQFLRTLRSMNDSRRQREERSQMNEGTPHNNSSILEHRSLYLEERRRRARSQVRALQRLSSSFENLAGHERSCIFAGHHRTGRCSCQNVGRTDDSNTRASISRIIMLAEALFEVLDEIHHQSMALSSRSPVSSLGSFPAPDDVVNSMPVRTYNKKENPVNDDDAQCYICLVEYEEGEHMRVLPCHHEFHLLCVDKWLKEVHRVCPLCRGNVCDTSLANHVGGPS